MGKESQNRWIAFTLWAQQHGFASRGVTAVIARGGLSALKVM